MAEKNYISREAVTDKLTLLRDKCGNDEMAFALNWALKLMDNIPAADVEPVRHGEWVRPFPTTTKSYTYICGLCGMTNYFIGNAVGKCCSHCMAKMDGGKKA